MKKLLATLMLVGTFIGFSGEVFAAACPDDCKCNCSKECTCGCQENKDCTCKDCSCKGCDCEKCDCEKGNCSCEDNCKCSVLKIFKIFKKSKCKCGCK